MKKRGTSKKQGSPDSAAYAFTVFLTRIWLGGREKITIDDRLLRDAKAPYVLLSNHESFEDFYYIARMAHPRNPSYVINAHYCTMPFLKTLAKRSGMIPKKLFTRDMTIGIKILRTIRKGFPLVIFPEGRLSPDGRTNAIAESGAALYRSLKTDLVLARIEGAYFAHPKWRRRRYRTEIRVDVRRVLHPEELQGMSDEEIDRVISETIYNDASEDRSRTWPQKDKAEGLENLLYRCTACGTLYRTEGKGNVFTCHACGRRLQIDETYHFTEEPGSISAYYEEIRRMESEELESLSLHTEADMEIFPAGGGRSRRETGVCMLTPEGFSYRSDSGSFTVPAEELPALAYSCGKEFELYNGDELYYFYPKEQPVQAARWGLAADLLAEKRNADLKKKGKEPADERA